MTSIILAWFSAGSALVIMVGGLIAWLDSRATLKIALQNFTEGLREVQAKVDDHETRLTTIETTCKGRYGERELEIRQFQQQFERAAGSRAVVGVTKALREEHHHGAE